MKQQRLEFFDREIDGSLAGSLRRASEGGARTGLLVCATQPDNKLIAVMESTNLSWRRHRLADFSSADCSDVDLVLVTDGSAVEVSSVLQACIGIVALVIAPMTEHHFSRRMLYLMSIPKAGTHMLIRLLELMGLPRSSDRAPLPGTWCTPVGFEYHAPCRDLLARDWFSPLGRQLLFNSPAIFVYRNPLDILVSERDWFVKPEHAFSGYLNCFSDPSDQMERLIADQTVAGNIRDRINRFSGWMNFENVVPVSYEELVGRAGGGCDSEQKATIWSLQLKLHIPGSPEVFGAQLYDPTSATFSKGKIGRHVDCFTERHFELLKSLPQDFMQSLGYSYGSLLSSKVQELRRRSLKMKVIPDESLYVVRLMREGILGFNVVEIAGKYYSVRQGESIGPNQARALAGGQAGFMTLTDALESTVRVAELENRKTAGTLLVAEGYCGFNVICHNGSWFGFAQAAGSIDVSLLDAAGIQRMRIEKTCVVGDSLAYVKAEILRSVLPEHDRESRNFTRVAHFIAKVPILRRLLSYTRARIAGGEGQ